MAYKSILTTMLAAILLGGCAFGDRVTLLQYPPPPPEGAAQAAVASPSTVLRKGQPDVIVGEFVDQRPNKSKIGFVQNTYGMETADVIAANDVTEWIRNALVTELQLNGYRATLAKAKSASGNSLLVTGEIQKVLTKAYFSYNSEIIFTADVMRASKSLGKKTYVGRGGGGVNIAATGKAFGRSIALALQDALRRLVADIRQIK